MYLLTALLFTVATSVVQAAVCVLNYERIKSPVTKAVEKAFKGAAGVTVKSMALPLDLQECIKAGSTEIVIIAHALETKESEKNKSPVPIAYFKSFKGTERDEDISQMVSKIDKEVAILSAQGDAKTVAKLRKYREKLLSYPEDRDYIKAFPILPRAFVLAAKEINKTPGFKKIRLLSCSPQQVLDYYKDFFEVVEANGIQIEIAPKNRIMSLLKGKIVTSPDLKWLRKSIPTGKEQDR